MSISSATRLSVRVTLTRATQLLAVAALIAAPTLSSGCRPTEATCGDGVCEGSETVANCRDCAGPDCGDGICSPTENLEGSCEEDCTVNCGDGFCNVSVGESCGTCQADCGSCILSCGNGTCEPAQAEACNTCPDDCGACEMENTAATCSDGLDNDADSLIDCQDPDCAVECLPPCGDAMCESGMGENCQVCAGDCGACLATCDALACDPFAGETCINCPDTCPCGTASCATAWMNCLDSCDPGNSGCILDCYEQTTGPSQGPLVDLLDCATTTCSSSCIAGFGTLNCTDCTQNLCDAEIMACPFF